jgi:hypothetical protein
MKVGLPVPAEGDTENDAVFDQLIEKWDATTQLRTNDLHWLRDEKSLIRKWQGYAQRRLPDAVDTAFGITVNNHTAAKQDGDSDRINFDRKRIQRDDLDDFFKNLKTFVEAENREYLIGPTFVMDEDAQGKDWDNVVILTAAPQGTAQNINGNMFAMVAESESLTLTGHLSDLRMSISPTECRKACRMRPRRF